MKRVFIGILYILMLVMTFVYLVIGFIDDKNAVNVLISTADTGLPIIGMIFTFPAFVFAIIALCNPKPMFEFLRDAFSLFSGVFAIASTTICLIRYYNYITGLYIPVILFLCASIISVIGVMGVISGISNEKLGNQPYSDNNSSNE